MLHKVVTAEPAPLQHANSMAPVPEELQATISGALAKDAASRFPSADSMIAALRAAQQAFSEQDTQATLPMQPVPVLALNRRRRLRMAVAVAVVGLVGVGSVAVGMGGWPGRAGGESDLSAAATIPQRAESAVMYRTP